MTTSRPLDLGERPGHIPESPGTRKNGPRHRPKRRRWRLALLLAVVFLVIVGVASTILALQAGTALIEARRSLTEARTAMLRADAARALEEFGYARAAFERAEARTDSFFLRFVGILPGVGRSVDTTAAIAEAGGMTAGAGEILAGAVEDLPRGPEALAPRRGRIPLGPIRRLADPLDRSAALLSGAHDRITGSPRALVLGPVAGARDEFEGYLRDARRAVVSAAILADRIPAFLGGEGTRRYFVGAQNLAEHRGTGGFVGAYSIMTVKNGRIDLGDFQSVTRIPRVRDLDAVEPPNPSYAERYDLFRSRIFWPNINMTPDFPSAAVAMERLYEEASGERLDGAILTDPFALAALLRVTGPAEIRVSGARVNSSNVVSYVANEAFADLPPRGRKRVLGDTAEAVLRKFLRGRIRGDVGRAGQALVQTAADGHLLLHSKDPSVQEAFRQVGVDGRLVTDAVGDYLNVVANEAGQTKTDYYVRRTVRYDVNLGAAGTAVGEATVTLENDSPTRGQPRYVIGPNDERFKAGENATLLSAYCAPSCLLDRATYEGQEVPIGSNIELGHPVYTSMVEIPAGKSRSISYRWAVTKAWHGDVGRGTYQLTFQRQPTIRPTQLELRIQVPDGMRIVEASPELQVSEDRAVWDGQPEDLMTFQVTFERPLFSRVGARIVDFLNRPVVRF